MLGEARAAHKPISVPRSRASVHDAEPFPPSRPPPFPVHPPFIHVSRQDPLSPFGIPQDIFEHRVDGLDEFFFEAGRQCRGAAYT